MKAVIQTPTFLAGVKSTGMSDDDHNAIVDAIASNPLEGDLMVGTGGCRKRRFAGRNKGKSGGYRTIHFNGADDVPVLLLALIDKGERDNLSKGERNELRKAMQTYEASYRASVAAATKEMKGGA